jgi:hypothetical protein
MSTLRETHLVELIRSLVSNVVSHPDNVNISRVETPKTDLFYLTVHADDLGRLLGREGKTVEAIRTMVDVAAGQFGKTAVVDVVEPKRKSSDKPSRRRSRPRRGGGRRSGKPGGRASSRPSGRSKSNAKSGKQNTSSRKPSKTSKPNKKSA